MQRVDSLEKTDAGRDWGQEEKGTTEDEMAGWHHQLNGHEFGWTPGVGDGQGGLVCCNSWGRKESDTTEQLNCTELNWTGVSEWVSEWSCSVMSDSLQPHGLYSLSGSSVHGIFQGRVLEWIAISSSRGSFRPRNRTWVSHIAGRRFTVCRKRNARWQSGCLRRLHK